MTILIESIILCILFALTVYLGMKEPLKGIHNYPPEIQQRAYELGLVERAQMRGSKKVIIKKLTAAVILVFVLALIVRFVNGAESFLSGFGISYLLWNIVNWFDVAVVDCLWFCNSKHFVIAGTEDLKKEYRDYWFHVKGGFRGMLIGLPVCLLSGAIVCIIVG